MKNALIFLIAAFSFQVSAQMMPEKFNDFYSEIMMSEPKERSKKLDKAIKKEPNEPWYYWMVASFQSIIGQDAEAVKSYEKAISVDPNFSAGHGSLARHLYNTDSTQLHKALIHINKAIQIDPDEGHYLIDRGIIYLDMKEYDKAMRDAELASSKDVDPMQVQKLKIEILYKSGKKKELHAFVNKNDLSEEAMFLGTPFTLLLAGVYEDMGQLDKACALYHGQAESYMMFDDEIPSNLAEKLEKCK